ncbi:hypothetical protein HYH03_018661 [Edaphochlamys debaryana]|uniref:Conserved oligomeric Golgi complex subunit 2 n=1 Tax=Edaphochlamys debaryana TaxID=47281 RepID=A0A835XFJ9_9CHLO|nr:hypothetical protein HYH03_018661 [Edaphochlamys debaryana]|eukprot:KAG2482400.1 hypothetical protein HYH03_018661 [Edaphochlamys debaryana]
MAKSKSKSGKSAADGAKRRSSAGGARVSRKDDQVLWFQREGFDPMEYLRQLQSEKELDAARHELASLNDYCKQEVQKVVHSHHKDFLEASRDIQEVEGLVDELRNYVSGCAAVAANLAELPALGPMVAPAAALPLDPDPGGPEAPAGGAWGGILALQAELLQDLQVAVAEQDFATARALLAAGRDVIAVVERDAGLLAEQAGGDGIPAWRYGFEGALAAQKAAMIEELQRQLAQTNSSTCERRAAAQALGLLAGPGQATQALLRCHTLRVRAAQQHLLKQHSAAGGDPDGVEYAGGLAQRTFLAIGFAAEDVRAVFPAPSPHPAASTTDPAATASGAASGAAALAGGSLPAVSALVVQWAADEAAHCAALLQKHALAPFVATGGAVGALLCAGLALVFCAALEFSHGLALGVVFREQLWPMLEAIVRRHLLRLKDEAASAASLDSTNAALQAAAGGAGAANGSAFGRIHSLGTGGRREHSADGAGEQGDGGPLSAGQVHLPALFPPPGASAAPTAPAGLSSLPMLLPELRALAEGLAPLAWAPAVALLRQGAVAAFGAVCEQVHASLSRLVGSSGAAGAGGGGGPAGAAGVPGASAASGARLGAAQGPLLAAYVAKAEAQLRLFAQSELQSALLPLAHIAGPVAPPELLLPALEPLAELLAALPPPATDALPPEAEPVRETLLQQHSSGVVERIRQELESEQSRRDTERRREQEGRRSWEERTQQADAADRARARAEAAEAKRRAGDYEEDAQEPVGDRRAAGRAGSRGRRQEERWEVEEEVQPEPPAARSKPSAAALQRPPRREPLPEPEPEPEPEPVRRRPAKAVPMPAPEPEPELPPWVVQAANAAAADSGMTRPRRKQAAEAEAWDEGGLEEAAPARAKPSRTQGRGQAAAAAGAGDEWGEAEPGWAAEPLPTAAAARGGRKAEASGLNGAAEPSSGAPASPLLAPKEREKGKGRGGADTQAEAEAAAAGRRVRWLRPPESDPEPVEDARVAAARRRRERARLAEGEVEGAQDDEEQAPRSRSEPRGGRRRNGVEEAEAEAAGPRGALAARRARQAQEEAEEEAPPPQHQYRRPPTVSTAGAATASRRPAASPEPGGSPVGRLGQRKPRPAPEPEPEPEPAVPSRRPRPAAAAPRPMPAGTAGAVAADAPGGAAEGAGPGATARRPNRFGVKLSSDEDEAAPARPARAGLRRPPRTTATAAEASADAASEAPSAGPAGRAVAPVAPKAESVPAADEGGRAATAAARAAERRARLLALNSDDDSAPASRPTAPSPKAPSPAPARRATTPPPEPQTERSEPAPPAGTNADTSGAGARPLTARERLAARMAARAAAAGAGEAGDGEGAPGAGAGAPRERAAAGRAGRALPVLSSDEEARAPVARRRAAGAARRPGAGAQGARAAVEDDEELL